MLVIAALLSPFLFPLPFTALLALLGAVVSAWVPLVVGVIIDALYWSREAYAFPLWTLFGAAVTLTAFFVHRFVETSIMRG